MTLAGLRLLVVDDDHEDLELTADAARRAGIRLPPVLATDVPTALAAIRHAPPFDACLLDDNLGPDRAEQVLGRLRDAGLTAPVLIVTGRDDEATEDRLLRAGAQDYLTKGELSGPVLARALRHALERAAWTRELVAQQAYLGAALDALPHLACIIDADRRIVAVNAAWRAAAHRGSLRLLDAGVGADYFALMRRAGEAGEGRAREALAALEAVRAGTTPSAELEYDFEAPAHEGEGHAWRAFRMTVAPFGEDAAPRRLLVLHEDTTAARRLEDAKRESQKMEALGQLAGAIAHDFNNLLTSIRLNAEVLQADLAPSAPEFEDLLQAVDQAGGLTRQLLAFGRRQVLQLHPVDVGAVLRDHERLLRRVLPESIALAVLAEDAPMPVMTDATQLVQAVLNLAINARDAMMPHGGTIEVDVRRLDVQQATIVPDGALLAPGAWAVIAVSDTGVGISPEVRRRIFEPFFTTKEPGRGTGLGLSIVHGIVHQLGGGVGVESELGQGSTFRVYLPLQPVAAFPRPEAGAGTSHAPAARILVVEDEESVRELLTRILRRVGHTVHVCRHGRDALRTLDEIGWRVDLLVTDVVMPEMGGGELATAVRRRRPELPVLFVSGYPQDASVVESASAGHAGFLHKPFSSADLLAAIRDALVPVP